ncbi:MAG TPA: ATP synthase F1 subunit epsilon [Thermoanaerobaculia bacterium]
MAGTLHLEVVTPERRVVESEADSVELPGSEGYLGILPGHTALVTLLKTGVLSYKRGGSREAFAVSAGLAEIADDKVSVLADSAQEASDIDAAAAERERSEAEKQMATASADTLPEIRARLELAQARLAVARRA